MQITQRRADQLVSFGLSLAIALAAIMVSLIIFIKF